MNIVYSMIIERVAKVNARKLIAGIESAMTFSPNAPNAK